MKRFLTAALAAALAAAVVQVVLPARPAAAASSIGGTITRSEVIQRATNWYNRRYDSDLTYDQGLKTWDGTHSRQYRRDCSGYVDMAWHLGGDPNTTGLMDSDYTVSITRSQLLPGDILDDVVRHPDETSDHVILFGGWQDAAKTHFWYYSFGGTPIVKHTGASFSDDKFGSHPVSDYVPRRYKKIVADPTPPPPPPAWQPGRQLADLNHDGRPELIGRTPAGNLLAYPHNNTSTIASTSWSDAITIGLGWNKFSEFIFADLNNDGLPEIVAIDPAVDGGRLYVYPHKPGVTAIAPTSWDTPYKIGAGWNVYDDVFIADLNHDGLPELIGRNPTQNGGDLIAYPHKPGVTDIQTTSWDPGYSIGSGWNVYDMIGAADINNDGYPELWGRNPDLNNGNLVAYPHKPGDTTIQSTSWNPGYTIGLGWNIYDAVLTGDLTADGYPELIARAPDTAGGQLRAYPHKSGDTTIQSTTWTTAVNFGTGWNVYDLLD